MSDGGVNADNGSLDDGYLPEPNNARMCFDFERIALTGWLNRRVEAWSYSTDAQWRGNVSLDINQDQLIGRLADIEGGSESQGARPEKEFLENGNGIINLPLCDMDRDSQVSDWSIRDRSGQPLRLILDEMACPVLISALNGALLYEGTESGGALHQLPILESELGLTFFLSDLFKSSFAPTRADGTPISLKDDKVCEAVHAYFKSKLLREVRGDGPDWLKALAMEALGDLELYWMRSPMFRFFVTYFSLRRIYYAKVDLARDDITVVKYSMLVSKDIVPRDPWPRGIRYNGIFGDRLPIPFELDGLGVAEELRFTVTAPEGTYFIPNSFPGAIEGARERTSRREKFYMTRFVMDGCSRSCKTVPDPEAEAIGSLALGSAMVKANKTWRELEGKRDKDEHPLVKLNRRLPIGESHVGPYYLMLRIGPRLGLRGVGYVAFLLLSMLAFLVCALNGEAYSGDNGAFTLATLFVLAPMVVAFVVNREEEPFIRRLVFRVPRFLAALGLVCDVVGFILFMLIQTESLKEAWWGHPLAVGMTIACFALSVICIIWAISNAVRKRRWSKAKDAFGSFKVPIYVA